MKAGKSLGLLLAVIFFLSACTLSRMETKPVTPAYEEYTSIATVTTVESATQEPTVGSTVVTAVEPTVEVQVESTSGIKSEFLLDGNLKINKEAADKYYKDFVDSLARNKENKDYMEGLLGANPDGTKLLDYLKKNDYTLPPGLNLPYQSRAGLVKMGDSPIKESIRLDTLKIAVYGPNQWNNDLGGVKEYISSLKTYGGLWTASGSYSVQCFGWGIDLRDNRLVMVAGAKETAPQKYPQTENMTIGGFDGNFDFGRDSQVASGELIEINKILKVYPGRTGGVFSMVDVFGVPCGNGSGGGTLSSEICQVDMDQFFGQGKTMFEPGK